MCTHMLEREGVRERRESSPRMITCRFSVDCHFSPHAGQKRTLPRLQKSPIDLPDNLLSYLFLSLHLEQLQHLSFQELSNWKLGLWISSHTEQREIEEKCILFKSRKMKFEFLMISVPLRKTWKGTQDFDSLDNTGLKLWFPNLHDFPFQVSFKMICNLCVDFKMASWDDVSFRDNAVSKKKNSNKSSNNISSSSFY